MHSVKQVDKAIREWIRLPSDKEKPSLKVYLKKRFPLLTREELQKAIESLRNN